MEGASLREVCQAVDDEIVRLGGQPAFPTQSSRNEIAAHYCPSPEDETRYADGDLAKLDVGVHLDGYVVDTATTVNVGDRPGRAAPGRGRRTSPRGGDRGGSTGRVDQADLRGDSGGDRELLAPAGAQPVWPRCGPLARALPTGDPQTSASCVGAGWSWTA